MKEETVKSPKATPDEPQDKMKELAQTRTSKQVQLMKDSPDTLSGEPVIHQVTKNEQGNIPKAVMDEAATLSSMGSAHEVDATSITQAIMEQLDPCTPSHDPVQTLPPETDNQLDDDVDKAPSFLSHPLDLRSHETIPHPEPRGIIPNTVRDELATPATTAAAHEILRQSHVAISLSPFQCKGRSTFNCLKKINNAFYL